MIRHSKHRKLVFFGFVALLTNSWGELKKPNIIYILVDDMGYSDLGCYGGEIDTPNLDRLATEGLRFRQFYNNAKCEPTRTSLMTGLYHGRGTGTSAGATLAEALATADYRNYAVGKWHLGGKGQTPIHKGFDHFYGFYGGFSNYFPPHIAAKSIKRDTAQDNQFLSAYPENHFKVSSPQVSSQTSFPDDYYLTDSFGDNAVTFIKNAASKHPENPFFLYLAFNAPHTPLQAPVNLIEKYLERYTTGWDQLRKEKWQRQKELGIVEPHWQLPTFRDDIPSWKSLSPADREIEVHRRAVYAAMMDSVDQNIGKILTQLKKDKITENTLVLFSSDNGAQGFDKTNNRKENPSAKNSTWSMGPAWAAYSNTPFRYYKQSQQQGGICSPLIARWPRMISSGTITDQPAHIVDIMATFVEISKANYDSLKKDNQSPVPPMDGKSLVPIFKGEERPAPDFWGFEFSSSEFAVIKGDWKIASFSSSPWRLYNLKEDRTEVHNLRWKHPKKVQELAADYDEWAADTYEDQSRTFTTRDKRQQLSQELRYLRPVKGGLYQRPGSGITLSNIGEGPKATVDDHWEFYLTSTSAAGFGETSDQVTFASKPFVGDSTIIALVENFEASEEKAEAGIMLRESLATDSTFFAVTVQKNGEVRQVARSKTGKILSSKILTSKASLPLFFKISRKGNLFTPSYSENGFQWISGEAMELTLKPELFSGLVSSSGTPNKKATITFREWEIQ